MQIFVAPYANPLAGEWTDAADAVETYEKVYARANGGDVGLMDTEVPGTDETTQPDVIVALAEVATERGNVWRAYLQIFSPTFNDDGDVTEAADDCDERYRGTFDSDTDFAWEHAEGTGMLQGWPEQARRYFNAESFARDLMMEHESVWQTGRDGDFGARHYFATY